MEALNIWIAGSTVLPPHDCILKTGIIERIDASPWISPIVVTVCKKKKKNWNKNVR